MSEWTFITYSASETEQLGKRIGKLLTAGQIVTLEGDLGAGKTTLTKGLAKGVAVQDIVNSPTFTIIKEYEGRVPFYHMDVYRLEGTDEDLGFEEYFASDGITVIEWASMIADYLPPHYLMIRLTLQANDARKIELVPFGNEYVQLCKELKK